MTSSPTPLASHEEAATSSVEGDISLPSSPSLSSSDGDISLPSSPSLSTDDSSYSDASSSEEPEPNRAKKPRAPAWPSADEVALLEAVAEHRKTHGRFPTPGHLLVVLRGRLQIQADGQQVARRLHLLYLRYCNATRRLSRGTVPVTDDDMKIYRISKQIWEAPRKQKMNPAASCAHHERRELEELEALYPCLAAEVEAIEARGPCSAAGLIKRAFGLIGDRKATELEAKLKKQRLAELNVSTRLSDLKNKVSDTLLELIK